MKLKPIILVALILFGLNAFSQIVLLEEHFNKQEFPAGWTGDGPFKNNWKVQASNYAGGAGAYEVVLQGPELSEGNNGQVCRLVLPTFDLTTVTNKNITVSYSQYIRLKSLGITTSALLGVAYSLDGKDWELALEEVYLASDASARGKEHFLVTIPESTIKNASTLKISFYYNGSTKAFDPGWYIDDVVVCSQEENSLQLSSLSIPNITSVNDTLAFNIKVKNSGTANVNKCSFSYKINDKVVTEDYSFSSGLKPGSEFSYTFQNKLANELSTGNYAVYCWVSKVNGITKPTPSSDKQALKILKVASQKVSNPVIIEDFTSSTCNPCALLNWVFNPLLEKESVKAITSVIKYPGNYPSPGDPYTKPEFINRFSYYTSLQAYPSIFMDGQLSFRGSMVGGKDADSTKRTRDSVNASAEIEALIDIPYKEFNYASITGVFNINKTEKKIIANVTVKPYFTVLKGEDYRIMAVLTEKVTTKNRPAYTNNDNDYRKDETEYHHVAMKILTDANGMPITMPASGQSFTFSLESSLNETFIEDSTYSDLDLTIFLQDNFSKSIYAGANAIRVDNNIPIPTAVNAVLSSDSSSVLVSWDAATGVQGYNVYKNDVKINTELITGTSFTDQSIVKEYMCYAITAIADGEEGLKSQSRCINNTNVTNIANAYKQSSLRIYPNPANHLIYIMSEYPVRNYQIFDLQGQLKSTGIATDQTIDIRSLKPGVYILRVNVGENWINQRFIKK